MKVQRLILKNYRGFSDFQMDFDPRLNLLVGVNGAGKTSILESLAILLSRLIGRIISTKGTGRFFSEYDIRQGTKFTSNTISIVYNNELMEWTASRGKSRNHINTITQKNRLKLVVEAVHSELERDPRSSIPLATYCSVNRSVLDIPLKIKKSHLFDQIAAYDEALSPTKRENNFRLFFEWFRNREDLENENRRYIKDRKKPDGWEFPDRQLKAVKTAIYRLMPGFSELRVRRNPLRMVVNKNGQEFNIEQLSDGEKCLLAMVGDVSRRLAIANPSLKNPLDGVGVVLIDEIDLHLHPAWQRLVIPRLLGTFPNCQFIVTTHSPQVLGEVDPNCVMILHWDSESNSISGFRPAQAIGLDSSEILEEIMGTSSRNKEISERISYIFSLIDEDKFGEAQNEIRKLKFELRGSIPELVRAESMITTLDIEN